MTDLINSLKTLASSPARRGPDLAKRRATGSPSFQVRDMRERDSCTESAFAQWRDAMRMVARLPGGLPNEFRLRLWENLADRWLAQNDITWDKIQRRVAQPNARDQEISEQIARDLHRTGCVGFSVQKQLILKEVLLAFARWNGDVGYCQGLNMIGATLLQMTGGDSRLTLKILIFVIDGVLPQGYFSQGLQGLAIDMTVFREILKTRKPTLHAHLSRLQKRDDSPPLTDVFTMHWFLTLFVHCLPTPSLLRIWDLLLLEGSEVLLRTALVLWAAIETRVISVQTTDEFYSVMGVITREMVEFGLLDPNSLVKCIVSLGSFPYPGLKELRERHRNPENLHKSFFLPKKELDALKRHYAAIRHRQRKTTIIMKNLETTLKPKPKVLVHQKRCSGMSPKPKPKVRRVNSKGKSTQATGQTHQVTLTWDKTQKKSKKLRKRRPSASSMTTSSSSTELCDTDNEADQDSDRTDGPSQPKSISRPAPDIIITPTPTKSLSFEETEAELILLTENSTKPQINCKPLDTSDSQYFLDELSRIDQLRKSYGMIEGDGEDNFYESLSQRICQLQFQNLTLLTHLHIGTVLDPDAIRPSPLPSPISPILSFHDHFSVFSLISEGTSNFSPEVSGNSRGDSPGTHNFLEQPTQIVKDVDSCGTNEDLSSSNNEDTLADEPISTAKETRDEITTIIRENLAILQRLKLKASENDGTGSDDSSSSSSGDDAAFHSKSFHRGSRSSTFNPFPTARKPRTKTSKFGLYK